MPTLYKNTLTSRTAIFAAAPGLSVMEALFDSLYDQMFCVKNAKLQYVCVNAAFVTRAGLPHRSAAIGRTAADVFPPLLAAGYEQQDELIFTTGRAYRDKLEMITNPDGSTGWYLTQKQPIRDAAGRVIALAAVSSDLHMPAADDPRLTALAGAVERIQREYASSLRIEDLAGSASMSLSQFERRMRRLVRVSPRQLLTQTRIEAAAKFLRETSLPLAPIAATCGFYDQAQLCRQFKAAAGITPLRYRLSVEETRLKPD